MSGGSRRKSILVSSASTLFVVAALVLGASAASAHHGSAVSYDTSKQITLTGVVTEWVWKNPHVFLLLDVTDEQGKVVNWGAETHPTNFLVRNEVKGLPVPLNAHSFKAGDRVATPQPGPGRFRSSLVTSPACGDLARTGSTSISAPSLR